MSLTALSSSIGVKRKVKENGKYEDNDIDTDQKLLRTKEYNKNRSKTYRQRKRQYVQGMLFYQFSS